MECGHLCGHLKKIRDARSAHGAPHDGALCGLDSSAGEHLLVRVVVTVQELGSVR